MSTSTEPLSLPASSRRPVLRWLRTRAVRPVFLVVTAGSLGVATLLNRELPGPALALLAGWLFALHALFRLAHDLGDRDFDRRHHPHRVTARVDDITPLIRACWVWFGVLLAGSSLFEGLAGGALFALGFAPLLAAELRPAALTSGRRLLRFHGLALKYPAAIAVLAAPRLLDDPPRTLSLLAAVYLLATTYELLHDPLYRNRKPLLIAELVALSIAVGLALRFCLGDPT